MSWDAEDERRVSRVLNDARDKLDGMRPDGAEIVFEALCLVTDLQRRMVMLDRPSTASGSWPTYLRTKEEHADDARQRLIDLAAGDPIELLLGMAPPSPAEVSSIDAVFGVFRDCIVGKKQERDWKILNKLAQYSASLRDVARMCHVSHVTAKNVKEYQCAAIWSRVKHLMPKQGRIFHEAA